MLNNQYHIATINDIMNKYVTIDNNLDINHENILNKIQKSHTTISKIIN